MKKTAILLILFVLCPVLSFGQNFEWIPGATYNSSVPTPESVLGYEIGSYLTDHHQMDEYIHALAESAPDMVRVIEYAQSYERRKMYLVIISSPQNMQRLEEIRTTIGRLIDPRTLSNSEVDRIVSETPPIGFMNFSTDGNETAAFEVGIQLAYQLTAGTDPLTRKIRENVVTIINPSLNPDSHQKFVAWAKAAVVGKNGTADPNASEHSGEWFISSDGNHYSIDLNRDAFILSQVETQAVAKILHHWNPQVWVDNHGQPNEFNFGAPHTSAINLNYPESMLKWETVIGRNIARYFDNYGWTYVKDETYDLHFPGYWEAYPAFNGAIGLVYETDAGGTKGFTWEKPDKSVITFRDGIHHQFTADVATLEALADNREDYLRYYYDFFKSGLDEADNEQFKQYVLPPEKDEGRRNNLVELLLRHQIEVYMTDVPFSSRNSRTYYDRESKPVDYPSGTYIIPVKQPRKRFLKTLLEPDPKIEKKFLDDVAAKRARNRKLGSGVQGEGLGFYDITAWSLPVMYGLTNASFTEDAIDLPVEWLIEKAPGITGNVTGGRAGYAYLFSYETNAGAKLTGKLLQEDYNVALAVKDFKNNDVDFSKGTLVVRVQRNPESLHRRIGDLARDYGVNVTATNTAWSEEGISLGSGSVRSLQKPRIMVLTHNPTGATSFGSVYSLLEQRYDLNFTAVRGERFGSADLSRYNVIIFPDGNTGGYQRIIGESGMTKLKGWIQSGGTFVAIKGAAAFAVGRGIEMTDVKRITSVPDNFSDKGDDEAQKRVESIPGSIFKINLNNNHYLGLTYPNEIAVPIRGNYLFNKSESGTNVGVLTEKSFMMGHKWEDTDDIYTGKIFVADVPVGQGHAILFADDPTFRNYWQGLDRLFLSSILFATAF